MPRFEIRSLPDPSGMDKRIQVQRRSLAPAANGEQVETWTTIRTVWASIVPLSSNEIAQADSRFADARFAVTVRHQPDIAITHGEHRFAANQSQWKHLGFPWDATLGAWADRHMGILGVSVVGGQKTIVRYLCQEWAV